MTPAEVERLRFDWRGFWARGDQCEPEGDWEVWLAMAGRGWGKTRVGAEWVRERVDKGARSVVLVGRTADDVRKVMIEGESGILACYPNAERPRYYPGRRELVWPNGAKASTYSAEKPDSLRGPQCDTAWCDELAAWEYPEAWTQVQMGLRSAMSALRPRALVTTTPRPTPVIREILSDTGTHVTRGTTFDNVGNMAPGFFERMRRKFEGTRLGRQELFAEILDDAPGALWRRAELDQHRVRMCPELRTIVVAVDPAMTSGEDANETGIVVAGVGEDGHGYVLADLSGHYSPNEWGAKLVKEYQARKANRLVAEVNQGGDLVAANIATVARDMQATVSVTSVHAAHGKRTRAEPVAALYEQGRVHHVGVLAELEDQLCTWEPEVMIDAKKPVKKVQKYDSPDRLDALVWALTDLMVDRNPKPGRGGHARHRPAFEDRTVGD